MHEYNYSHWLTTTYVNSAGLFAGEIKLNTCCVAMVKLRGERVVELSMVAVLLNGPNLHCHPGSSPRRVDRVPCWCSNHRCRAKLKRSSATLTTITALAKTQRPLMCIRQTNQNNTIHPLRKNISIVTMHTADALLRHFRKT